jgi:hypothetical protein
MEGKKQKREQLIEEIKGAVLIVKERISEYEEYKNSFIDPEANRPYILSNKS